MGLDLKLVALSTSCLFLTALLGAFEQYLLEHISERMVFRIRNDVAAKVIGANLERIESVQTGELTSALGADTAQLRGILSQGIVEIIVQSLTLLGALVMMFVLDWVLAVVVILAVLLLIASGVLLGSRTRPAAEAVQDAVGEMSANFGRVLGGIRTVKAFAGEQFFLTSVQVAADSARRSGLRVAKLKAVVSGFTQSAIQILLFAVIGLGALRVASGSLTIGDLASFVMYVMLVFAPAAMLGGVVASISEAVGAYARIARIRTWSQELSANSPSRGRLTSPHHCHSFYGFVFRRQFRMMISKLLVEIRLPVDHTAKKRISIQMTDVSSRLGLALEVC
ncbi:ABC transporter ATP-binding protein [Schaalia sp. ZJ1691]|uniref:ABC transporter ATP-binding protein n=1 Tax=Schaalia sp. ZJ1691 TaxID=2709404 RepID=UPI00240654BD|nr:ABC transporter ATP-binding protein [Schaalia sp. ZJ1691]